MAENSLKIGAVAGLGVSSMANKAFGDMRSNIGKVRKDLKKAQIGETLSRDVLKYKKSLEQLKVKQREAGRESPRMARGIADLTRKYKAAKREAKAYGITIADAARSERKYAKEAERHAKKMQRLSRSQGMRERFGQYKGQIAGVAAGGYAFARQSQGAQTQDRALTRLSTVLGGDNRAEALDASRASALSFSRRTGVGANDLLGIEYALNSAGLGSDTSRSGSKVVAKVATVTDGVAEQVGETIATVFNNFGDRFEGTEGQKLSRIGDLLTQTQLQFQLRNFGQLGEGMKYATSTLQRNNIGLEQGLTLLGMLNTAGLQGGQAGTSLDASLRNMTKASDQFGFDVVQDKSGGLDVVATLAELGESIGGFEDMTRETSDELQQVFGDEGVRGITALGKFLERLPREQRKLVASSRGVSDREFSKFVDDGQGQWQRLTGNFSALADSIGVSMLPVTNMLYGGMADLLGGVGDLVDEWPNITASIGTTVAAFGVLRAAILTQALLSGNAGGVKDILSHKGGRKLLGRGAGMLATGGKALLRGGAALLGTTGGALAASGAVGYGAGTLLSDHVLAGTSANDAIGEGIAKTLAFFGNDEAQKSLERMASYQKMENSFVIHAAPGQDSEAIALAVRKELEAAQAADQRGALYDY